MARATINDVELYYEVHGEGFPLILCYGLGGNTTEWAPQVAAFSQRYRLILWDARGHGKSGSPQARDRYGLDVSGRDLLGLMDHLAIPKAHVGGLSMGAGISMRFALANPDRVESLLIIDSASASGLPTPPDTRAMRERTIELALTQGMEAVAHYAMESNPNISGRAAKGPEAAEGIMDMYLALDPVGYAHSVDAVINAESISNRLSEIGAPTLALAGAEDPALPAVRFAHERISGSKFVIIPGAGHLANLDQPDVFTQEVLAFLSEVDARRGTRAPG